VLETLPGMTPEILSSVLQMREQSIFSSSQEFRNRLGLSSDSAIVSRLAFDRGTAPAVLSVARIRNSTRVRREGRVQMQIQRPRNRRDVIKLLAAIERDSLQ